MARAVLDDRELCRLVLIAAGLMLLVDGLLASLPGLARLIDALVPLPPGDYYGPVTLLEGAAQRVIQLLRTLPIASLVGGAALVVFARRLAGVVPPAPGLELKPSGPAIRQTHLLPGLVTAFALWLILGSAMQLPVLVGRSYPLFLAGLPYSGVAQLLVAAVHVGIVITACWLVFRARWVALKLLRTGLRRGIQL